MTGPRKKPSAEKATPAKKTAARKAPAKKAAAKASKRWSGSSKTRFGARGRRLWSAHHEEVVGERGLALLEEACRIADRLDKLDALLKGESDAWARLVFDDRSGDYELRIDSALIEARQQANVFRQLIAGLPLREAAGDDEGEGWVENL